MGWVSTLGRLWDGEALCFWNSKPADRNDIQEKIPNIAMFLNMFFSLRSIAENTSCVGIYAPRSLRDARVISAGQYRPTRLNAALIGAHWFERKVVDDQAGLSQPAVARLEYPDHNPTMTLELLLPVPRLVLAFPRRLGQRVGRET